MLANFVKLAKRDRPKLLPMEPYVSKVDLTPIPKMKRLTFKPLKQALPMKKAVAEGARSQALKAGQKRGPNNTVGL